MRAADLGILTFTLTLMLVNETGTALEGLALPGVSPLTRLEDGASLALTPQACRADLSALSDAEPQLLVWHALTLCGVREIRLGYDPETGETTAFTR